MQVYVKIFFVILVNPKRDKRMHLKSVYKGSFFSSMKRPYDQKMIIGP